MICQYNKLFFILLAGNPIMHYTNNGSRQMVTRTFYMATKHSCDIQSKDIGK